MSTRPSRDIADARELIRARLEPAVAEPLAALIRPSLALAVIAADDAATSAAGESAFGGLPRLPADTDWPACLGRPMHLLAQLDCAALAPLFDGDWPLPTDGHLLFFHDDDFAAPFSADRGDDGCRVLHVPADAAVRRPAPGTGSLAARPWTAGPQPSLPTYMDDEAIRAVPGDGLVLFELDEDFTARFPTPRQRLLGWCDDTNTPRPEGHRPLLQLEAEAGTAWGEVVNVSFWICEQDLLAGNFDRVRRSYDVA
ncbi:DUF1963 domain-containing protein [Streptomyces sp. NPDC088725]|uniref:DUF1963 domain-containing protein n=1 Tax=Streptomyces sp. NPDC088725 TaxID=3365873 RepID=UPI00380F2ADA